MKQFSGICARRLTGYVKLQISNVYTEIKEYFLLSDLLILNIYTKMKLRFFDNSLNFFFRKFRNAGQILCVCSTLLDFLVKYAL